ncbi:MAG: iron-containing redox enzyme family protein [Polyangiales bacterium]
MKELVDECARSLKTAGDRFPWDSRRAYGDWLAQTYYYVRHSTRLLAAAAARFPLDDHGSALHYRFAAHIVEEKRHEQLALHDLKYLGLSLDEFEERHATRMFYEPQYYKIEHQAPSVLFGYILPLEAIAATQGKQISAAVVRAFGPKCDAFLRVHGEDDVEHLEKALQVIESVAEGERAWLVQNLRQSTTAYCRILDEIVDGIGVGTATQPRELLVGSR